MDKASLKEARTDANNRNKQGIVMFIVLATVLVVILLANILLGLVSSQSRLTHHQVSRIQAYYAAKSGINYAIEQLRLGNWLAGGSWTLCRTGCDINDPAIPGPIQLITITVGEVGGGTRPVSATATYTYSP